MTLSRDEFRLRFNDLTERIADCFNLTTEVAGGLAEGLRAVANMAEQDEAMRGRRAVTTMRAAFPLKAGSPVYFDGKEVGTVTDGMIVHNFADFADASEFSEALKRSKGNFSISGTLNVTEESRRAIEQLAADREYLDQAHLDCAHWDDAAATPLEDIRAAKKRMTETIDLGPTAVVDGDEALLDFLKQNAAEIDKLLKPDDPDMDPALWASLKKEQSPERIEKKLTEYWADFWNSAAECDECFGTGLKHGFQTPCSRGCSS